MQLANILRHLMVAILLTLTGVSFAQAQAWLERPECSPFISVSPETLTVFDNPNSPTAQFILRFIEGTGDTAVVNVDALIASVNPVEKARACGFAQPGSNESYSRVLRTHNVGLKSTMSFNDFVGWLNQHSWRITYWPLSATDVAAWDQAAPRRTTMAQRAAPVSAPAAASAPAVARQTAPVPQGLTPAQVRRMIEEALPAAPTELTDDQLAQVVSLLEQNFAGFGAGMSDRLTQILAGYAKQEEVAAFAARLETVADGLAQFSNRLTAVEEQQAANGRNIAAAQSTADEARVAADSARDAVSIAVGGVAGNAARLGQLAEEVAADRAANAARFGDLDNRLGALTIFGFDYRVAGGVLAVIVVLLVLVLHVHGRQHSNRRVADLKEDLNGQLDQLRGQVETAEAIASSASALAGHARDGLIEVRQELGMKEITLPENLQYDLTMLEVGRQIDFDMMIDGVMYTLRFEKTRTGYVKPLDGCIRGQYNELSIKTIMSTLRRHGGKGNVVGTKPEVICLPAA